MTLQAKRDGRAGRSLMLSYSGIGLAVCVFIVAILVSFQTLFEQKRLIEKESRINLWFLAETEIGYLRLMEAYHLFGMAPERMPRDQVIERFEIFWSRLPILLKGPQSSGLREVEGLVELANSVVKVLETVEPELELATSGNQAKFWEVHAKLVGLQAPLHDMVRRALLYETDEVNRERTRHETYYYELIALFGALLAGGAITFILLLAQIAKTRRAVQMARDAEEASTAARTQLEVAIGSISEGFILYDPDDRIALFNNRYRELHPAQAEILAVGITFEEVLRISVQSGMVKPPAGWNAEEWIASCVRLHLSPDQPFESRLSNGRWLKISERRTTDGRIVGIHTDITEMKSRELQLTEKTTLLQTTLDHMTHGIAVFDSERRLLLCNDLFLSMHGLAKEFAAAGRAYSDIVRENAKRGEYGPGDASEHVAVHMRYVDLLFGERTGSWKLERRRPSGGVLEITYTALPNGGFVKTYSDITDRVHAEKERARLQEQFHAAERMQALGTLAGGIAHDFNNILGIMLGNCELALSETTPNEAVRSYLDPILAAGERARGLVHQVLSYSRRTRADHRPIDVANVVTECLKDVRAMVSKDITIERGAWSNLTIAADTTQLHQIILNLCINAAHAIGEVGGRVSVSIEEVDANSLPTSSEGVELGPDGKTARFSLERLKPGKHCRILIRDSGTGMSPDVLPRIFEPFFTTKEVGKGTGLGLAAVHGIVRDHGGAISVETTPGVGTSFAVYLPLVKASIVDPVVSPVTRAYTGQERIMLIDDDQMLITVTTKILRRQGYEVEAFTRPEAAIAAFKRDPRRWDLVVTDRNMPGMSGEALILELLKLRADLLIVMMTGFANAEDEERIRLSGAHRIVIKPVVGKELAAIVREVIDTNAPSDRAIA